MRATTTVEMLINTAPTAGGRVIPAHENAPAAKGIVRTLYPAAHARFSTIFR